MSRVSSHRTAGVLLVGFALIGLAVWACGDPDSSENEGDSSPTSTVTAVRIEASSTSAAITASAGTVLPATITIETPGPVPSTTPEPPIDVVEVRLKYALFDRFGSLWWCDPDFYPIAREDEQVLAEKRFPEIEQDAPAFAAILAHLGYSAANAYAPAQKLAVYRDWKMLRGLHLDAAGNAYRFNARFTHDESTGVLVEGMIAADGRITVTSQQDSEPPICPICLARGTRIATPDGPVAVEDLRAEMVVWTAGADGAPIPAVVVSVGMTPVPAWHRVVRLVLADGRSLRASPSHPLADGRLLGAISPGDQVDGTTAVSAESEQYDGGATFDLLPSGVTGTYWADGIAVASTLRRSSGAAPWGSVAAVP